MSSSGKGSSIRRLKILSSLLLRDVELFLPLGAYTNEELNSLPTRKKFLASEEQVQELKQKAR